MSKESQTRDVKVGTEMDKLSTGGNNKCQSPATRVHKGKRKEIGKISWSKIKEGHHVGNRS